MRVGLQVETKDKVKTGIELKAAQRRVKQLERSYERNKHKDPIYASKVEKEIYKHKSNPNPIIIHAR